MGNIQSSFASRLTSKRGSKISLALVLLVFVALFGIFSSAEAPSRTAHAPADSDSAVVSELLGEFPNADRQQALLVATNDNLTELSPQNVSELEKLAGELKNFADGDITGPLVSDDGKAAVLITPITVEVDNADTAATIKDLRAAISDAKPDVLNLQVTGGPAFAADIAESFDGADFTLLLVTVLIVAVLLIVTYRSPILWLIPLLVVALAAGLAGRLTAAAGAAWDLQFDAGIISVLVFGAVTVWT